MGTAAGVRMLGGGYNPMAESPIAMLMREFEWDYVAVRCQFVSVSCLSTSACIWMVFSEQYLHACVSRWMSQQMHSIQKKADLAKSC